MCGICGASQLKDEAVLRRMNAALATRGPDDEGIYIDRASGVGIGARRLSIIDVEGGHQPLSNEDGTVWAALNGEIYNHPALQRWLQVRGHKLRSRTDTEVLVHLYEEFGDAFVHSLEGMFALAIWDARRKRLVLARDRFGEKPLFYSARSVRLTFASELTALVASGDVSMELDPRAVDLFFVFGYVPGAGTIFTHARQLPPGHLLIWSERTGPEVAPYWSPVDARSVHERFEDQVEETRYHLERSVRSRMLSDVPLGVFLSGGVDSTLIAALAARNSSGRVKTFTIGYDVGTVNETAAARRVAAQIGSDHHELILSQAEAAERAESVLASVDQPLADPALTALNAVAGLARRHVTVTIGGEGADELFAGYPRYRWIARAETVGRLIPTAAGRLSSRMLRRLPANGRRDRLATVIEPRAMLDRHLEWVTGGRLALRDACYGPRLAGRRNATSPVEQLDGLLNGHGSGDPAGALMRLDQRHWLPDDVLMKADRAGMLESLEIRTPYLHRELAEFAASVPTHVHMRNRGKALLRAALAHVLPEASSRPKTAFRVPVDAWLSGPLASTLGDLVHGGRAFDEGWFNRNAVSSLAREHASGKADQSATLWPILALGLWLERLRQVT
jgi:asparagine synthase (glutamine-hydrolysing)